MDYNIIWLDDHFDIPGDPMETMYSNFKISQSKGRYSAFHIDRCTSSEEMKEFISNNRCRYDAVILDVLGRTDDQQTKETTKPFFDMMNFLRNQQVIVKIFSGELESISSVRDYIESNGLEEDKDYFFKQNGYQSLFNSLESDLKNSLALYKQFPELLDLVRKVYLPSTAKPFIDNLLKDYLENDSDINHKTYFRELLLIVYDSLVERGYMDGNGIEGINRFSTLYNRLGQKPGDRNHPENVPIEICPDGVKKAVLYTGWIASQLHHVVKNGEQIFSDKYYETLIPSMYPATIMILRWFYELMSRS